MSLPRPGEAPFHLLVLGPFAPGQLRTSLSGARMTSNDETRRLVAAAWEDRSRRAAARGQWLFPGPMCRLHDWGVTDGVLRIGFGLTDYRELVGTNLSHP